MSNGSARMVFLGFGKYARADRIYALEPILGEERGARQRTLVWVEGVLEPIVASRTQRKILHDMGQDASAGGSLLEEALALAEEISKDAERVGPFLARSIEAESGVDLKELGLRASQLFERSTRSGDSPQQI